MPTPYVGREFTFTNPDGTQVRVRGYGNQYAAVFETLDGFTVAKDPQSGFYHYARISPDGKRLEPTGPRVGTVTSAALDLPKHARPAPESAREGARAAIRRTGVTPRWAQRRRARKPRTPAPPLDDDGPGERGPASRTVLAAPDGHAVGSYVGLCLLVRFPDVADSIPSAEVAQFCNAAGYAGFGNNGSVRDYFLTVSDGRLDYTSVVTGYVTAKHPRDHYTDPSVEFGTRARQLIREGLKGLKAQGFDFSQLTADSQGYVRALNVFYAGPCVNDWSEGLWPHSSALDETFAASSTRTFSDYQITNIGSELTLRTFCHENGHMVCDFPDLYDYGYESNGVGDFCLMCGGGSDTNPVQVSAYLKNQAGWTSRISEASPGTTIGLDAGTNDFLIHRRSRTEYFILENRQRAGRDESLPDAGIAIWHADETGSNDNEAMTPGAHYECSLEQADGHFDLERMGNSGDAGDLFAGPSRRTFGAATTPSSRWWDDTPSGLEIVDISASGTTMTITTAVPHRVSVANLKFGVRGNADVQALQAALNTHFPGLDLPTTGNYLQRTDEAVRRCQQSHGFGDDPAGKSFVGKRQAAHLGLVT
jgi:M6 family metalloprotease-like protein